MVITRISDFGIKIVQGSYAIAANPPVDKKEAKGGTFNADLVLLSAPNSNFDSGESFSKSDKSFVISSPGEYEKDDLFFYGLASKTHYGTNHEAQNTIYYFNLDGMDVCILGALESESLPSGATEVIDNVDILILPVIGDQLLSPVAANKLATKLEASIVIPTGHLSSSDNAIKAFRDEFSHEWSETDKLTLKSSDISGNPKAVFLTI